MLWITIDDYYIDGWLIVVIYWQFSINVRQPNYFKYEIRQTKFIFNNIQIPTVKISKICKDIYCWFLNNDID